MLTNVQTFWAFLLSQMEMMMMMMKTNKKKSDEREK